VRTEAGTALGDGAAAALDGAAKTSDDSDAGERSGVVDLLERASAVAVPLAVGLYAMLYLSWAAVYGEFNVTPEQVGVDQSTMLARTVGALVLLILIGALLIGPLVALGYLLNKITFGWAARLARAVRARPWLAALIGALWCGVSYWGFLSYLEVEAPSLAGIVLVSAAIGVAAFLVPFRLLRRRPVGRAGMKLMMGTFTAIGLGFALMGWMENDARTLAATGRPGLLLDLLGFQDQWVSAEERESGKPLRDGARLMLLGETDGLFTFYDCAAGDTFRISKDATLIRALELSPERADDFDCRKTTP
jgi:hypothetical protein